MIRKNGLFLFLGFLVIAFIVLAIQGTLYPANWAGALTTHTFVLNDSSRLELLWVQTVFNPGFTARQLAATGGKVFFVGSLSQNGRYALVALDTEGGHKLWQVPRATVVDVGPETVYVDNEGTIVAYSLTGKKLWRTPLGVRYVVTINVIDGKLYVGAIDDYLLDAVTGELLATAPSWSQPDIFVGNFASGIFWHVDAIPAFTDYRVFTRDRESEVYGESRAALALDRQNGEVLWRTAANVISNVVATESLAFVITYEDELRILDARTGRLLEKMQIEPSINFFAEETQRYERVYQLAVDQTTQTLYVLLGDSNQLFAFRIHE